MPRIKKGVFTLNLNPDAYQEVTDLTYPLIKEWSRKLGADFMEIKDRKFPEALSPTYEKCQVYQLAQDLNLDWAIFVDADALIHPDTMDFTNHIGKDTVMHHGADFASIRWRYDKYFWRDGRNIGSCTWFIVASDWCLDIYKPLDDISLETAYENIFPISEEVQRGVEPFRLIEDYVFSRNIAKYGLKFITVSEYLKRMGVEPGNLFWHLYAISNEEKVARMKQTLKYWGIL
jgi:hypothetical protein